MYNSNIPNKDDLPSSAQLIRSTIIALAVACALLVTVVLPAEYGIDPTGAGSFLGLTEMGDIKTSLEEEAMLEDAKAEVLTQPDPVAAAPKAAKPETTTQSTAQPAAPPNQKTDERTFFLDPGQAAEIKLIMNKGASASFSWQADGPINFDTHGDPVNASKGFYHGYGKGRGVTGDEGVLVAAFDGSHGWFWRNRSGKRVTVTLKTKGEYQSVKRVL